MNIKEFSHDFGPIICRRKIIIESDDKKLNAIIRIWQPKREKKNWICPFYISQIGLSEAVFAYGADGFQAIIMALVGIRVTLDKTGSICTWVGAERGETGFPRMVSMGYGVKFSRKLEQLIDNEVIKFEEAVERVYREKNRRL